MSDMDKIIDRLMNDEPVTVVLVHGGEDECEWPMFKTRDAYARGCRCERCSRVPEMIARIDRRIG